MTTRNLILCLAASIVLLTQNAVAANNVQITNAVFREVEQKNVDGSTGVRLVDVKSASPGDKVRFLIAIRNETAKPAENLVVTNPIPADLEFASASAGAEVSVDGGKSFGSLAALTVKPLAGTARAAQAADVTHVRWRLATAVAPSSGSEVSFSARVR
jgi:uncharacterized repeat protein (TIGR01451 family)